MGQMRQAHCPVGTEPTILLRWRVLGPLLTGFTISSVAIFALSSVAGNVVRTAFSLPIELLIVFVLVLCVAADLAFPRVRLTLIRRQTPLSLARFPEPITGLLWGMDTGTVVSTYRASAASWAALILTFAGWGPWWTGIFYAAAFCTPLGLLIASYPLNQAAGDGEGWRLRSTESWVEVLGGTAGYVRSAAAITAVVGVAVAVQGAL